VGGLEEPSSFEEAHAWWDVMEIGSKPIMDVVIASLVLMDTMILLQLTRSIFQHSGRLW
jgi:hypothetical protein